MLRTHTEARPDFRTAVTRTRAPPEHKRRPSSCVQARALRLVDCTQSSAAEKGARAASCRRLPFLHLVSAALYKSSPWLAAVTLLLFGSSCELLTRGAAFRTGPHQGPAPLGTLYQSWGTAVLLRTRVTQALCWKGAGGRRGRLLSLLSRGAPAHRGLRDGAGTLAPFRGLQTSLGCAASPARLAELL